jgi:hypothetical protein
LSCSCAPGSKSGGSARQFGRQARGRFDTHFDQIDLNAYNAITSNNLERDLSEKPDPFFRIPLSEKIH